MAGGAQRSCLSRRPAAADDCRGSKRRHIVGAVSEAELGQHDDDFVEVPGGLGGQGVEVAVQANVRPRKIALPPDVLVKFPALQTRGLAKTLVRAVSLMNAKQRVSVIETGLEHILQLKLLDTPPRLGYWLVSNFDRNDLSLTVQGHRKIHITRDDVAAVLGLPLGGTVITKRHSQTVGRFLREWRLACGKTDNQVSLTDVCDHMLADKEGGEWFKRHFAVLVATTLIESNQNGNANQNFVHMLEDVSNIRDLDWCGHLLDCLVSTRAEWSPHTGQKYTGPIVFLSLLYVDRVVLGIRDVPRTYPAIRGWTTVSLKHRQMVEMSRGGFGHGVVDLPLRPTGEPNLVSGPEVVVYEPVPLPTEIEPPPPVPPVQPLGFVERFAAKAKLLATTVLEIVEMVGQAPQQAVQDHHFKQVLEAAQTLLGLRAVPNTEMGQTLSQEDDAFWANANNIAVVEEVEKAILRRRDLIDMPTFSLGLSQEGHTPMASGLGREPTEFGKNTGRNPTGIHVLHW